MKKYLFGIPLLAVTLVACPPPPTGTVSSIALSCSPTSMAVGATSNCSAVAKDASGNNLATQSAFTFDSSDTAKATVSSTGVVTGVAAGSTNIKASSGGVDSNVVAIMVTGQNSSGMLASILLACNPTSINVGATSNCTATGKDSSGATLATQPTFTFGSSNTGVANVSSAGLVTGMAAGTGDITATSGGITSNAVTITVNTANNVPNGGTVTFSNQANGANYSNITCSAPVSLPAWKALNIGQVTVKCGPSNNEFILQFSTSNPATLFKAYATSTGPGQVTDVFGANTTPTMAFNGTGGSATLADNGSGNGKTKYRATGTVQLFNFSAQALATATFDIAGEFNDLTQPLTYDFTAAGTQGTKNTPVFNTAINSTNQLLQSSLNPNNVSFWNGTSAQTIAPPTGITYGTLLAAGAVCLLDNGHAVFSNGPFFGTARYVYFNGTTASEITFGGGSSGDITLRGCASDGRVLGYDSSSPRKTFIWQNGTATEVTGTGLPSGALPVGISKNGIMLFNTGILQGGTFTPFTASQQAAIPNVFLLGSVRWLFGFINDSGRVVMTNGVGNTSTWTGSSDPVAIPASTIAGLPLNNRAAIAMTNSNLILLQGELDAATNTRALIVYDVATSTSKIVNYIGGLGKNLSDNVNGFPLIAPIINESGNIAVEGGYITPKP